MDIGAGRAGQLQKVGYVILAGAVVATVVVYGLALALACKWVQQPFLGLFLEQNNVVSTTGQNAWVGRQAGIAYPEQLVAVGGLPLETNTGLVSLLAGYQPGDTAALTLQTPDGNQRDMSVTLAPFASWDLVFYFAIPYAIGLVYLIIGLWVFRASGYSGMAWSFALYCVLVGLVLGSFFDLHTSHALVLLWSGAVPFASAALAHTALTFPAQLSSRRLALRGVLAYAPAVALFVYTVTTANNLQAPWGYIPSMRLNYLFAAIAALFLLGSQVYRLRVVTSTIQRQQSRTVLLGSVFSFAPLLAWMLLEGMQISVRFYATIFFPFLIIFPLTAAYAIVRYRLRDIDQILRRGLAHSILVLGFVGAYFLLIGLWPGLSADNPLVLTLFILVVLTTFQPLRRRLEHLVDRVLVYSQVDYGRALGGFSQQLTTTLELDRVLELVTQRLQGTLSPTSLVVFLCEEDSDVYKAVWARDRSLMSEAPVYELGDLLPGHLRTSLEPLYYPAGEAVPEPLHGDWLRLQTLGLVICVPLRRQEQLSGWLALGPAATGRLYSREDLGFVVALANQSALAIENAHLYTELRRRLQELKRTQDHLIRSEKMASLGRLAADVAHEIGNPLSLISGYLEILWEDTPPDAPGREYLQTCMAQVDRITILFRQLLAVSRPSRQKREPVDLNQVIVTVLGLAEPKLRYQQVELSTELAEDLPLTMADAAQLQQVLLNLTINAVSAMPDGGHLRLSTRCQDGILVVEVEDTGVGIPVENMVRIFEPFFTTREDGTGLGLAISYAIITEHGGDIEVWSRVGQGTRFAIKLPLVLPV